MAPSLLRTFVLVELLGGAVLAQTAVPHEKLNGVFELTPGEREIEIPGQVRDLALDAEGRILYCTSEGEVGRIAPQSGLRTVLATTATAWFPNPLRAVVEALNGDVAVLDIHGHIRVLPGGSPPADHRYVDDLMIQDATDMIIDAAGNYLIASSTPSNGLRAVNWVSASGQRWSYYLVRHSPVQLCADPLTGGIVISDAQNGGNLQLVAAADPYRRTTAIDSVTHPGVSSVQDDGAVAAEADGDLYWAVGGNVYRRGRAAGVTTLYASGFGQLRGAVIAHSSSHVSSPSGWSLYLAEGQSPTRIRELPNVGAPGAVVATNQGVVPVRGQQVNVIFGFQVFDLTVDDMGRLLVGGTQFQTTNYVKRITLTPSPSIATVATTANGLSGIVEGLVVAPDDSIYALTRTGSIQRITEGPLSITTVFNDPTNAITAGKDLVRDVNGSFYVADRDAWGAGQVIAISGGGASVLSNPSEARGLAACATGGMYVSTWNGPGFSGAVDRLRFSDHVMEHQPGFSAINYTNDYVWGDGDLCVDANGSVYSLSEDDWSLVRYDPGQDAFVRVGSMYENHPSGLVIAPSTPGSGSTTGWSLYVSEFDFLWEKISVAAPASTYVDSSLGLMAGVGRAQTGVFHPQYGQPRAIAAAPFGGGIVASTSQGWVLALDVATGEVAPLAGPDQGLRGDLVALASHPGCRQLLVANDEGEVFALSGGRVRRVPADSDRIWSVLESFRARERRWVTLRTAWSREDYVLEGWVVWRVTIE